MASSEADVKNSLPPIPPADHRNSALEDPAVKSVLRRWKIDDSLETSVIILRVLAWIFSLLAFAITASNKHGDWMNFDKYQEYRYLLSISVLAFLYTTAQLARNIVRSRSRREILPAHAAVVVDFAGDQIAAYLLISSGSAAAPITSRMHESVVNSFTDSSAASVVTIFFAFTVLALSALVSGFKLARHNYA